MKYGNAWHIFRAALEAEFVGKIILSDEGEPFRVDSVIPEMQEMDGYVQIIFYGNGNKTTRYSDEKERLPEIWPENIKV